MNIKEQIDAFIAKRSKAAMVLELLLDRKYVTGSDIIKMKNPREVILDENGNEIFIPFTTCPQSLIREIRNEFGCDFVQDTEIKFYRVFYKDGKIHKVSDFYKRYFLKKMEGINV